MRNANLLIVGLVLFSTGVLGTAGMHLFAPQSTWAPGQMWGGMPQQMWGSAPGQMWERGMMGGMMGPGYRIPSTFSSDGQRIYYTATSDTGVRIAFDDGPMWLYMHGGSCVSCHGPHGRGGFVVPMTNVIAPDIRYSTLSAEQLTDAEIRKAISQGLDAAGAPLNDAMPRYHMSDKELDELVNYLKTLDNR
jgi:cytochrome c oxidase subunit 2